MAAYSLSDRFSTDPKYYRFYDPGAYQYDESYRIEPAHAPFLSNAPRKTLSSGPIWTHAIYDADIPPRIPNCTSMMSKIPRFPYEALSKDDLEEILCKCGIPTTCQCPTEEEIKPEPKIVCQGKVPKHIIKGVPRAGAMEKISKGKIFNESPPFYDARVIEATMFYQGWKWSKWSGTRSTKPSEDSPGPADYTIDKQQNETEKCAEKVRAQKRKDSKQYRFIEMIQRRNILENAPGPANYLPINPKGPDLQEIGPKADRFPSSKFEVHPGPADHNLKRDFDPPEALIKSCHAVLPEPPCFGIKAQRFKARKEEGPSPATYSATYKPCQYQICSKAPFGSATERFKTVPFEDTDENEITCVSNHDQEQYDKEPCPEHSWEFKSKTIRMKPLLKCWDQPSPADFLPVRPKIGKPLHLQYIAPFCSSDGRFKPWYNEISVFGSLVTPGPGYYNLEKPRGYPAVHRGPLYRDRRFHSPSSENPAPNAYNIGGGIERILDTHNVKLKTNIEKHHQLRRDINPEQKVLTIAEKETLLINKCIALCEESMSEVPSPSPQERKGVTTKDDINKKKKLLRFFLYKHQMPICD